MLNELGISTYRYLSTFGSEHIYLRAIHDVKKIAKNFTVRGEKEYNLLLPELQKLQNDGYGIFFCPNAAHNSEDVHNVLAFCKDIDFEGNELQIKRKKSLFLQQLKDFVLPPSAIVETHRGFALTFLTHGSLTLSPDNFREIQKTISMLIDNNLGHGTEICDSKCNDIAHVFRVPGFDHLKNPKWPTAVKCIKFRPEVRYTLDELVRVSSSRAKLCNNTIESSFSSYSNFTDVIVHLRTKINLIQHIEYYFPQIQNIRTNVNFNCIFHSDKKPSAVISQKYGIWKYFCNSTNCNSNDNKGMDIIDITRRIENCSFREAVVLLCNQYGIKLEIDLVDWVNQQKGKYEDNYNFLFSDLSIKYPALNKVLRFSFAVLLKTIEIADRKIVNDQVYSNRKEGIFFVSNRYLASQAGKSTSSINRHLNLCCVLGLLNKLQVNKIPREWYERAVLEANSSLDGNKKYLISFYTIPRFSEVIEEAERRAQILLENKFSIQAMSYRYMCNIFGIELANEVYHQKRITQTNEVYTLVEKLVKLELRKNRFTTFQSIFRRFYFEQRKVSFQRVYVEFRRLLPFFLRDGFEFRRLSYEENKIYDLAGRRLTLLHVQSSLVA